MFRRVSLRHSHLAEEYMAWKKSASTLVVAGLACCAGLSQESRQTRELQQKIRVESDLVVLTVTVKDDHGKFVPGLLQSDFHVFDDGVEQSILSFTDESLPLSLLVLVDDDMKWRGGMPLARSVRSIIGDIADQDEATVCRFDMLFYPGNEFTSDSGKLMADLKSAQSASLPSSPFIPQPVTSDQVSTAGPPSVSAPIYAGSRPSKALDDALYSSAKLLEQRPRDRRRIILIFTDAVNEPKLNHHSHESVRELLLQDNISLYALVPGAGKSKRKLSALTDYSSQSGGGIFSAKSTFVAETSLTRMTEQARHDYTLVYAPLGNEATSTFHSLRVTAGPSYNATTRSGYYTANSDSPKP
jgi:Ca-activated chloride channel family protein